MQKNRFQVDSQLNIIVCAYPQVSSLDISLTDSVFLILHQQVMFQQKPAYLSTDTSYTVVDTAGHAYTLFFTQLPIVTLSFAQELSDLKQVAYITINDTSKLSINSHVGIGIRGASSRSWPKKKFDIEFWADSTGQYTWDVPLFGMRSDKDWIFEALYNEPLRIRSFTNWQIWKNSHRLHYITQEPNARSYISGKFVEVFINGSYRGVYALTEKIDRKQLKLKKATSTHIEGELFKAYDWAEATKFEACVPYDSLSEVWSGFELKYPDAEDTIYWKDLHSFIDFAVNSSDSVFAEQVKSRFDFNNAVDYFIFLNLITAYDNSGKNLYIARYHKESPYFFVPWDLDGTWGIFWDGSPHAFTNVIMTNPFFERLLSIDTLGFKESLKERWFALRESTYHRDTLLAMFKRNMDILVHNHIYEREHMAWSGYKDDTSAFRVLDAFMNDRLEFLDAYFRFPGEVITAIYEEGGLKSTRMYPNPASSLLHIQTHEGPTATVDIYSSEGKYIEKLEPTHPYTYDISNLDNGLYLIRVQGQVCKLLVHK
ncbi:MAG TPA: CotH kinase family protein [Cytophagales bacterium]|nr:CotH kinase family protein [Cytophagales bacterium]